ncbi:geranylgeranylglyceryl/heptaprenylglyceryl phosphate synthase [Mangrovimonas aestuarii]|uniref:geranylgeranylglyceryl/heptaprenylglyceryl phosphate synthase n=1 Tax=Mangrovimonas aestuarii TaxID=3018443 RepID=UPI002377F25A|nr:geranylgeranylglyceryl/heptaprenylglyceryl phosphate synthase [Mangrovimonas aestuarii]
MSVYKDLLRAVSTEEKLLTVLIDPDKMKLDEVEGFIEKVNASIATHIFVGGSTVDEGLTEQLINKVKLYTSKSVVIFPGDVTQLSPSADALLFLSLLSGRNPEYLIGKHVKAVSQLREMELEIIPTGYILIENGRETAVQRVTQTQPIDRDQIQLAMDTAKAGELLGMKLIYLEAGSGALNPVPLEMISFVKQSLNIPLIVGGGIRSAEQLSQAYKAGADMAVIGTAFENTSEFFNEIKHTYA